MENILSVHYERKLRSYIEEKKGERIDSGVLPILENLVYLAEKTTDLNGESKMFLKTHVKQMLFWVLFPTGRISEPKEIRKDAWTEITMSVYADKNDPNPIGVYTSIGIYDNICDSISGLEKIKKTVEMTTGAALSRALTRAGIGLEFFSDMEEEMYTIKTSVEEPKAEEVMAQKLEQTLMAAPVVYEEKPVETKEAIQNTPEKEQVKEIQMQEETENQTESAPENSEPVKRGRKKKEQPEPVAIEQPEKVNTENTEMQQYEFPSIESSESEDVTSLEDAYNTVFDVDPHSGKTIKEILDGMESHKKYRILYFAKRTKSETVKKAIDMVAKDLCEKDEEFRAYVESKK